MVAEPVQSIQPNLLRAALECIASGLKITPLMPREKTAYWKEWQKRPIATEQAAREHWRSHPNDNVGIVTGDASRCWALDVDGETGAANLKALEAAHGPLPKTRTHHTGGGGRHILFRMPDGGLKNSHGKIAEKLDVKADGGYIVAPGSIHPETGNAYVVESDAEIVDAPEWLLALANGAPSNVRQFRRIAEIGDSPKIRDGSRNTALTSLAGWHRRRGASEREILAALRVRNAEQCQPPLDESELATIAASIAKRPAVGDLADSHGSDIDHAKSLVAMFGAEIRFCWQWKSWLAFEDGRWNKVPNERVKRMAQETLVAIQEKAREAMMPHLLERAQRSESGAGVTNTVEQAKALPGMLASIEDFDTDENAWHFNVLNGTVDLRTGQLLSHDPARLIMKLAPVTFDATAKAPRWERFISEVFGGDESLIAYVQTALGYMLTGDTSEQKMFIAYGHGANGKSTLLNTIRALMGEYASAPSFSWFDADSRNSQTDNLVTLRGVRAVMPSEVDDQKRLAEGRVKSMTGGDAIKCRPLYGEYFEYTPQFKIWLATNHLPAIRGTDKGIWRRMSLVRFDQTFEKNKDDKNLLATLKAEASGILNWLLEGVAMWREHGLVEPKVVADAVEEYRIDSNAVLQWIEEECDVDQSDLKMRTGATDLFMAYLDWERRRGNNVDRYNQTVFGNQLAERGFEKKREKKGYSYIGIRPRENDGGVGLKG